MHLPWLCGRECAQSMPLLFCFCLLKTVNQSWSQTPAYPWAGWEKFGVVESKPHLLEGTLQEKQESIIPLTKTLMKPCLKFSTWTFLIYLAHYHLSKTMSSKGQEDISSGQRCSPCKTGDLSLIPRTHTNVERQNQFHKLSSDCHNSTMPCTGPKTHE